MVKHLIHNVATVELLLFKMEERGGCLPRNHAKARLFCTGGVLVVLVAVTLVVVMSLSGKCKQSLNMICQFLGISILGVIYLR